MLPLLAMAAANVVGGMLGAGKANVASINQATEKLRDQEDALKNNAAENKAIAETNLQNTIRTAYRSGVLNVQRAQSKKAAAQAGINLGRSRIAAMGATNANAAASGSIGSSVDAVVSDIEQQVEQAQAANTEDARVSDVNFDNELTGILQAGQDALQSSRTVNTRAVGAPNRISSNEVVGTALLQTAASYASAQMSLGLGKG